MKEEGRKGKKKFFSKERNIVWVCKAWLTSGITYFAQHRDWVCANTFAVYKKGVEKQIMTFARTQDKRDFVQTLRLPWSLTCMKRLGRDVWIFKAYLMRLSPRCLFASPISFGHIKRIFPSHSTLPHSHNNAHPMITWCHVTIVTMVTYHLP